MKDEQRTSQATSEKQRLSHVRNAVLDLHKVLVDSERVRYEKTMGQIQSPNQFLRLLTSDPWFAWLHPISQLIVAMDEALDERAPLTGDMVAALTEQTRRLLVASEAGQSFSGHYFEALQSDPDVVLAHAAVMKILGPAKEPGRPEK
jgi:hypothetical protein